MTDDAFFHNALDAHPDDQAARLLLAEWLGERGDGKANATLWMVRADKFAAAHDGFPGLTPTWDWWSMLPGYHGGIEAHNDRPDRIDPALMRLLRRYRRKSDWSGDCAYCEYLSRREAEDALADALDRSGKLSKQ